MAPDAVRSEALVLLLLIHYVLLLPLLSIWGFCVCKERSGSVVECLTRDREAGFTALWSLSKTHLF